MAVLSSGGRIQRSSYLWKFRWLLEMLQELIIGSVLGWIEGSLWMDVEVGDRRVLLKTNHVSRFETWVGWIWVFKECTFCTRWLVSCIILFTIYIPLCLKHFTVVDP